MERRERSRSITLIAIFSALYVVLTVAFQPISYSWLQIRISEALTPIPFLFGFPSVVGIFIGCFLANLLSPIGLPDIVFGPLLSLLAAILSWKFSYNKKWLACVYPIIVNSFGVSAYVSVFYGVPYFITVLSIGISEALSAGLIGYPLLVALDRSMLFNQTNP